MNKDAMSTPEKATAVHDQFEATIINSFSPAGERARQLRMISLLEVIAERLAPNKKPSSKPSTCDKG